MSDLTPFFEPACVAVVGASRERNKIGSEILHNLAGDRGFTGTIVPVHPTADAIEGLPAYPRVVEIPSAVDLAVIVVPAAQVLDAVDDCLAKGVRPSASSAPDLASRTSEGRALERGWSQRIRGAGCRLIGPNCMGLHQHRCTRSR